MRTFFIFIIPFLVFTSCKEKKKELSLTFTGDVILDRGVRDEIRLHGDSVLVNSLKRFSKKENLIINYEGTFTDSGKSQKNRFNFKADTKTTELLSLGGVTHVSIANNHSHDYGEDGFKNTISSLKQFDIESLGKL